MTDIITRIKEYPGLRRVTLCKADTVQPCVHFEYYSSIEEMLYYNTIKDATTPDEPSLILKLLEGDTEGTECYEDMLQQLATDFRAQTMFGVALVVEQHALFQKLSTIIEIAGIFPKSMTIETMDALSNEEFSRIISMTKSVTLDADESTSYCSTDGIMRYLYVSDTDKSGNKKPFIPADEVAATIHASAFQEELQYDWQLSYVLDTVSKKPEYDQISTLLQCLMVRVYWIRYHKQNKVEKRYNVLVKDLLQEVEKYVFGVAA